MYEIAMSNWGGNNLYLLYLDPNGPSNANLLHQTPGGVWVIPGQQPPPAPGGQGFQKILGLDEIFIASAVSGSNLFYVSPQTGWNNWQPLTTAQQFQPESLCWAATWVPAAAFQHGQQGLLVAYVDGVNVNAFNVLYGLPGQMQLANIGTIADWESLPAQSVSVATVNNVGVAFIAGPGNPPQLSAWANPSGDGQTWKEFSTSFSLTSLSAAVSAALSAAFPPGQNNNGVCAVMVLPQGNPPGPLQVLLGLGSPAALNSAQNLALISHTGTNFNTGWAFNQVLLPTNAPIMVLAAAAFGFSAPGNANTLQLVALGVNQAAGAEDSALIPFLVSQTGNGPWQPFINGQWPGTIMNAALPNESWDDASQWQPLDDLAIAMGTNIEGGQRVPALQVAYLGADGNVYIGWQDGGNTAPKWYWYGGKNGSGLP